MGHHYSIPYSGGGLIVINVQAHLAWALAEKCGHRSVKRPGKFLFRGEQVTGPQDRGIGLFSGLRGALFQLPPKRVPPWWCLEGQSFEIPSPNPWSTSTVGCAMLMPCPPSVDLQVFRDKQVLRSIEEMETWILTSNFPFAVTALRGGTSRETISDFLRQRRRWHDSRQC